MNTFILMLGISAVAGSLGFMVGGSATPVVGVILPAIFGLVATAVGLYQNQNRFPSKDQLELFTELQKSELLTQYLESIKDQQAKAPLKIGLILLIFGVSYQLGAITGTTARTHQWFSPTFKVAPQFPWSSSSTKPVTNAAAFEWITLQTGLLAAGYNNKQIAELYEIQVLEWKSLKAHEDLQRKPGGTDNHWPLTETWKFPIEKFTQSDYVPFRYQGQPKILKEKLSPTESLNYLREYQESQKQSLFAERLPGFWLDRRDK